MLPNNGAMERVRRCRSSQDEHQKKTPDDSVTHYSPVTTPTLPYVARKSSGKSTAIVGNREWLPAHSAFHHPGCRNVAPLSHGRSS